MAIPSLTRGKAGQESFSKMLRIHFCFAVWLVLAYRVISAEKIPTSMCGEDFYFGEDGSCHLCENITCLAGFEPNLSCGNGNPLIGPACMKCQEGYFAKEGRNCQRCSVCVNTVNDTVCTPESDIICGPCKEGYVKIRFRCYSCQHVPYPSQHKECLVTTAEPEIHRSPVQVIQSLNSHPKELKSVQDNSVEPFNQQWNAQLVIIVSIASGCVLLILLIIALCIVVYGFHNHHKPAEHSGDEYEMQTNSNHGDVERGELAGSDAMNAAELEHLVDRDREEEREENENVQQPVRNASENADCQASQSSEQNSLTCSEEHEDLSQSERTPPLASQLSETNGICHSCHNGDSGVVKPGCYIHRVEVLNLTVNGANIPNGLTHPGYSEKKNPHFDPGAPDEDDESNK